MLGLSLSSFFTLAYADVIAVVEETKKAEEEDVLPPPPSSGKPKTDLKKLQQLSATNVAAQRSAPAKQVKTLIDWFNWVKNYPQSVTQEELKTLHTLITQTHKPNIKKTITPAIQDSIAQTLVEISEQKDVLSPAGKQIFSIISQKKKQVTFLSPAQIDYTIKKLLPAVTPKAPTIAIEPSRPAPTPEASKPPQSQPKTIRPTSKPHVSVPKPPQRQTLPRSYVADINAVLKLKKASSIIKGLSDLIDRVGTNQPNPDSMVKFTNALNSLSKNSHKFSGKLRTDFAALVSKTAGSKFVTENQKPALQILYNVLTQKPLK